MPKNKINFQEIEKTINNIKVLSDTVRSNLQGIDNLITDNVATGQGIWDGASATNYKEKWSILSEKVPTYINMFEEQATNLENYLKIISKTEEE